MRCDLPAKPGSAKAAVVALVAVVGLAGCAENVSIYEEEGPPRPRWTAVAPADTVFFFVPPGADGTAAASPAPNLDDEVAAATAAALARARAGTAGGAGAQGQVPNAPSAVAPPPPGTGDTPGGVTLRPLAAEVRTYDLGETHRLVLDNDTALPGENLLMAHLYAEAPGLFGRLGQEPLDSSPPAVNPSEAWLEETLPDVFERGYEVSELGDAFNPYGRYYFVTLEYDTAERCVLAWQELEGGRRGVPLPVGLDEVFIMMRYCAAAAPAQAMETAFDQVRLDVLPQYRGGEGFAVAPNRWGVESGRGSPYVGPSVSPDRYPTSRF